MVLQSQGSGKLGNEVTPKLFTFVWMRVARPPGRVGHFVWFALAFPQSFPVELDCPLMRGPGLPVCMYVCKVQPGILLPAGYVPTYNGLPDSPPPMTTASFMSSIYLCDVSRYFCSEPSLMQKCTCCTWHPKSASSGSSSHCRVQGITSDKRITVEMEGTSFLCEVPRLLIIGLAPLVPFDLSDLDMLTSNTK